MVPTEIVLLVGLALVAALVGRRVQVFRRGGTEVSLRALPAPDGRGWRHGVLRYRESGLVFFRVASLRLGADRSVSRTSLVVLDRREPEPSELDVVAPGSTVVRISADGTELEVALSGGALTAFLSWVESSPPGRSRRQARH